MEIQNSDQNRSSTNKHLSYNLLPHLKLKDRIIAELKIAIQIITMRCFRLSHLQKSC